MAEATQVYELVNSLSKQAFGETALQVVNAGDLVSLGDAVLSSSTNTDAFVGVMVDRIGKTIDGTRIYRRRERGILYNTFDYGCILQKLTVEPAEAKRAPQWELVDGQSIDQFVVVKPTIRQKLFEGISPWENIVTIPDKILRTAFTSAETLGVLISGIRTSVINSMEMQLENTENIAYANYIGEKMVYARSEGATGIHVINLLQQYNDKFSKTLTMSAAFADLDFLKYASQQISLWKRRIAEKSRLFNTDHYVRFTPEERLRITMLSDFVAAINSSLQADTFHNELTALPYYDEISYWQGSGQEYGYTEASGIDITTVSGTAVNTSGIIALMCDIEGIGMSMFDRRSRTARNEDGEYTNYFEKADIRYYNDMSENGIVFTVTDTPFAS